MSATEEKIQLGELVGPILKLLTVNGKGFRALDVFGKDLVLFRAISDPFFDVAAISNKEFQKKPRNNPWVKGMSDKQLSGRITRRLLLLREHGLQDQSEAIGELKMDSIGNWILHLKMMITKQHEIMERKHYRYLKKWIRLIKICTSCLPNKNQFKKH